MREFVFLLLTLNILGQCFANEAIADFANEARQKRSGFTAERIQSTVNGEPVLELHAPLRDPGKPQITGVQLLPGRGMNVYQVEGYIPGRGTVPLFFAPELRGGENSLGPASEDANGSLSFMQGGAFLIPYANIIRGKATPDASWIQANINGVEVKLPANYSSGKPGAERASIHGLILDKKLEDIELRASATDARATGMLVAGDFGVGWPSKTELRFEVRLSPDKLELTVDAKNIGPENTPISVGWHPYFAVPSGNRAQARLRIPAVRRLLTNNYEDVFPTGKKAALAGTKYNFNRAGGMALGNLYLDDCFIDLQRSSSGVAQAELIDPAARYGMRVTAVSPEIQAFQVYAPVDKSFVAVEPQYNHADPYNRAIWANTENTGMVLLKPGQSTTYKVELQVFTPPK